MTPDQLTKLKDGDIIRNTTGNAYTVLRNIGLVVIATRTVEITDAAEWEHVYTTTPLCGMTNELERLGWIFNIRHCEWTSPNGSYKTKQTQTAWGQRHDFPKREAAVATACPDYNAAAAVRAATELKRLGWTRVSDNRWTSPGGTMLSAWKHRHDFKPSPEPSLVHMIKEIQTLGWTFNENIDFWTSPDGKFKTPSLRRAWGSRNNYPRSEVKSFPEAREALRQAGWVNVAGIVWRAPSGCFFDGTRCAYDSMSAGFHKSEGNCNAS